MQARGGLHHGFVRAAVAHPENTAVVEPNLGSITYRELASLTDRLRDRLHAMGVRAGDRVGMMLPKSIDAVATMLGILKAGAAYVPVDVHAPIARGAYILGNCEVKAVVTLRTLESGLGNLLSESRAAPRLLALDRVGAGAGLREALDGADRAGAAPSVATAESGDDDLAYLLYTSGSTGKPKGVMLTHRNAVSFVDWCSDTFSPSSTDRFSSHAPFHFDLSILDVYVSLKHGATLVLVGEDQGKDAKHLARFIEEQRISCWYSAPSILSLIAQYGNLESARLESLRLVLFAGEVFPIKHLRRLTQLLPKPRYFNLYGPTETNVCTFYEVELPIAESRTQPVPIGRVCSHVRGKVVNETGATVERGLEGELCISGAGVMQGYWSLPEQSARSFLVDADGTKWYRTGDIVVEGPDGNFTYVGRRDRMVKRRGYRIELGEIESALYRHDSITEAAVVAFPDEEAGVRLRAFLTCGEGPRPSLIALKRFCSDNLPLYMIPDQFVWCESMPKTSTDKIDYQRLKEMG